MPTKNRLFARVTLPICAAILLVGVWFVSAGDLNPPPGPVVPTMKSLTEVEPRIAVNATNTPGDASSLFRITQPGSYYLTGNITGVAGKHGIDIAAGGVTLDLNGFDVMGVPGMGSLHGVTASLPSLTNITVVNGSVRNWGGSGVALISSISSTIRHIRAGGNFATGIVASGNCAMSECTSNANGRGIFASSGTVTNCSAAGNLVTNDFQGGGIVAGSCTVTNCSAIENHASGFIVSGGSIANCVANVNAGNGFSGSNATFANCMADNNTGNGISATSNASIIGCSTSQNGINGIDVFTSCTITDCTSANNTGHGISATSSGCIITGCTARSNGSNGIATLDGCTLANCTAVLNAAGSGIKTFSTCSLTNCQARQNNAGITTTEGCTITACTAAFNTTQGISAGNGSTVADCTARGNTGDGIRITDQCHVRANTCDANGLSAGDGAGIHATGLLNRIDGNMCTGSDRGIDVDGTRNVIVRNTCGSNVVNWTIVTGNHAVVLNPSQTVAINGDSGGTSLGTDPTANYTH